MARYLDMSSWPRRDTFEFFRGYDKPFFNVGTSLDVTNLVAEMKKRPGFSLSLAYHYFALRVVNEIEPFRYRLRGDQILVHDVIHGGTTLLLPNETFIMVYFYYQENFEQFMTDAMKDLDEQREAAAFDPRPEDNRIHFSVLPWISFTSFSHARNWGREDSVPKMAFGKIGEVNGRRMMPFSVEVHHAMMDGITVGRYLDRLQEMLLNPADYMQTSRAAETSSVG
jgi:chloramphenicol O-acetyltransferase type A